MLYKCTAELKTRLWLLLLSTNSIEHHLNRRETRESEKEPQGSTHRSHDGWQVHNLHLKKLKV